MPKTKQKNTQKMGDSQLRMSFLYKASNYIAELTSDTQLPARYGEAMKEISRKIVEKLHPSVKRSLCLSCSYPLQPNNINVKILPHKKKKRRRNRNPSTKDKKTTDRVCLTSNKQLSTKIKRTKRTNRIRWGCNNCGYHRTLLTNPNYKTWISDENT